MGRGVPSAGAKMTNPHYLNVLPWKTEACILSALPNRLLLERVFASEHRWHTKRSWTWNDSVHLLYARHSGFLFICTKTLLNREQHSQFWRSNVGSERLSYWAKDIAFKGRFGNENQMCGFSPQTNLLLEKWFDLTSEKKVLSSLLLLSSQNRSSRWNNLIFSKHSHWVHD